MADLDTNCFLRVLVSPDTRVSFRWIVSLYVRRMASTLTRSGGLPLVRSLDRCSTLSEAWASTAQGGTVDLPGMERRAWMVGSSLLFNSNSHLKLYTISTLVAPTI